MLNLTDAQKLDIIKKVGEYLIHRSNILLIVDNIRFANVDLFQNAIQHALEYKGLQPIPEVAANDRIIRLGLTDKSPYLTYKQFMDAYNRNPKEDDQHKPNIIQP